MKVLCGTITAGKMAEMKENEILEAQGYISFLFISLPPTSFKTG